MVGLTATASYAVMAFAFVESGLSLVASSALSYILAAIISYVGHRVFTFRSANSPAKEILKFVTISLISFLASTGSALMVDSLGGSPWLGILIVCALIPIFNFLALKFWVFALSSVEISPDV